MQRDKTLSSRILYRDIPLILVMFFIIFPFYWTLNTSLKSEAEIISKVTTYYPHHLTFQNYITAWNDVGFSTYFVNSISVAIVASLFNVICAFFVGYALDRFKFKGKQAFMLLLLCTQFIPSAMLIIPLFMTFSKMHLLNTLTALVLVYTAFKIPFSAIMMKGFINKIPVTLEEAAYMDGCTRVQAMFKVLFPMLAPSFVACLAFSFVSCWNEFLYALMFINDIKKFTLPVGLSLMQGEFDVNYGAIAAGSMIALVPAIALFAYIQKYLIGGLAAGSVKG